MSEQLIAGRPLDIVILCQQQFGSHIDTYYYSKYLSASHRVTYICWDYGSARLDPGKVTVKHVSRTFNLVVRNLLYLYFVCAHLHRHPFDVCFIKYFRGCSILRLLFPRANFIFDIRTGSVSKSRFSRFLFDTTMKVESFFFPQVTVISRSLGRRLGLEKKARILPIGSIPLSTEVKDFQGLHLVYAGTLSNRNIDRTLEPFTTFVRNHSHELSISYTIIGSGPGNEEEVLRSRVKELGMTGKIHIVGRVPFDKLGQYFDKCNVGVSFVPMTDFFDVQPATKTFDYLLSGMAVIATATSENKLVITENNGVLIEDTAEGFHLGLEKILARRTTYRSAAIMADAMRYHQDNYSRDLEQMMLEQAGCAVNGCISAG